MSKPIRSLMGDNTFINFNTSNWFSLKEPIWSGHQIFHDKNMQNFLQINHKCSPMHVDMAFGTGMCPKEFGCIKIWIFLPRSM